MTWAGWGSTNFLTYLVNSNISAVDKIYNHRRTEPTPQGGSMTKFHIVPALSGITSQVLES